MNTILQILHFFTGGRQLSVGIRRLIGMIIGASFMAYIVFKGTYFLRDFAEKANRTIEVQEKTLSQLEEIKSDVKELERVTATKGDVRMLDMRLNELDSTLIRTAENQKKLFWRLNYSIEHKNDSFIDILQEFNKQEEYENLNQKIESKESNLTTYRNEESKGIKRQ